MKLKRYLKFINEDLKSDLTEMLGDKNKDIKEDILEKIIKSLDTSEKDVVVEFLSAMMKDPEGNQIEGLINDADIYEFYLSYRNDIDEMLSEINFYEEAPSEMNSFSLYDYIIQGTKKAILEIITSIKEDLEKGGDGGEGTQTSGQEEPE